MAQVDVKLPIETTALEKPSDDEIDETVDKYDPQVIANWSNKSRYAALAGAYLMLIIISLQSTTAMSLVPYIVSDFAAHSLLPLTNLLAFVVSGVIQLPLSKVINLFGHIHALVMVVIMETIGHILMATCRNVEWYSAAYIIFEAAFGGLLYLLRVFVVDCARPRRRALAYGLTTLPYLVTPFAGPSMAEAFLKHSSWRWAFWAFAIMVPVSGGIMVLIMIWGQSTVGKPAHGLSPPTRRTKSLRQYVIEFDVIGMLLACIGIGMLLVSISVATAGLIRWSSATFIATFVASVISLLALVGYEKYLCPIPFVSLNILRDRSAWGAVLCVSGEYLSFMIFGAYFTSYLQVVFFQSVQTSGYISNVYYMGWGFISGFAGLLMTYTGRYRAVTAGGVIFMALSTGLMIYCSQPSSSLAGIIVCRVLLAISTGTITVSMMMAVLDKAKPSEVAMRIALFYMASMLSGAIGSTISTAIWRNTLLPALRANLPHDLKSEANRIAGSIVVQLSYEPGSPGRDAIVQSFAQAWKRLIIAATGCLGLSVVGTLIMKEGKKPMKSAYNTVSADREAA